MSKTYSHSTIPQIKDGFKLRPYTDTNPWSAYRYGEDGYTRSKSVRDSVKRAGKKAVRAAAKREIRASLTS